MSHHVTKPIIYTTVFFAMCNAVASITVIELKTCTCIER